MKLTNNFSNNENSSTFNIVLKRFSKYFYAVIVLSTTMLAAWALGDLFSVGGFTTMEIALLVVFSSTFLRFAAAFWNVLIDIVLSMFGNPSVEVH